MIMKSFSFSLAFLFFCLSDAYCLFQPVQQIEDSKIKRVAISKLSPLIYVASENSLFKSRDSGKTFKKLYVFKDESVAHIVFDPYLVDTLYLAAQRHLYQINDKKISLFNVPDEAQILSAAKFKGNIYVGTSDGLYYADSSLLNWKKLRNLGEGVSVYYIAGVEDKLLISTSRGLYSLDGQGKIKKVFTLRETEADEARVGLAINFIKEDIFNHDTIWLGTSRGLFNSTNKGKTWQKVYVGGIDNLSINCLAQTQLERNTLYLGSSQGFFRLNIRKKTAKPLFEGLCSSDISWAEFSSRGEIYLATAKGLFRSSHFNFKSLANSFKGISLKEPSITEIQQVSLKYNEVHPDKIRRWRKELRYRALAPSLSLDYDKTINYDSGVDRYFTGPRDWGVSLQWDLGNFIWNNYQDDIDTRSRLNTQLRLDILDEINRVYFERLRLKKEIADSDLKGDKLFDKKLRLSELTAIIDGYTGGYFSGQMSELNEE